MAPRRHLVLACLVLASSVLAAPSPSVDRTHSLMEPAHPVPASPRLRHPYLGGTQLSRLVSPRTAIVLLPATMLAMAFAVPDALAQLLLQVICFFGSLFEPFEPLLPDKGLLRTLVKTVKDAKRAWYTKQGLPDPSDTSFIDDDDDDDDDDVPPPSDDKAEAAPADEPAGGASSAVSETELDTDEADAAEH